MNLRGVPYEGLVMKTYRTFSSWEIHLQNVNSPSVQSYLFFYTTSRKDCLVKRRKSSGWVNSVLGGVIQSKRSRLLITVTCSSFLLPVVLQVC